MGPEGEKMRLRNQYIANLASNSSRIDKRKEDEFRKIEIDLNPITSAEGSARVRMGKTEVIAGVKMGTGEPFSDKPDAGVLMTGAELSPLSSPDFETGPPKEDAIELARVVDRGIRESGMIDTKKLCIKKGEKVWMVFVDIQIINHDGNLIDAASLAAVAALLNAKMPKFDGENVEFGTKTNKSLPVASKPMAVTISKIGGKLLVDCTVEEEKARDARITVTTKDNGNLCAMQKGGSEPLALDEIESAFEISIRKGKELRKMLDNLKA
jgi:exosome complex component RRP42